MSRRALVALTLVGALFLSGCVMPDAAPMVLADADGYTVISPCGDPIAIIEVRKSVDSTTAELYWRAEAHPEAALTQIHLFSSPSGYTTTPVTGALESRSSYIVWINGIQDGTGFVPSELKPGRGVWLGDSFDMADLAREQKKVADRVCPR